MFTRWKDSPATTATMYAKGKGSSVPSDSQAREKYVSHIQHGGDGREGEREGEQELEKRERERGRDGKL